MKKKIISVKYKPARYCYFNIFLYLRLKPVYYCSWLLDAVLLPICTDDFFVHLFSRLLFFIFHSLFSAVEDIVGAFIVCMAFSFCRFSQLSIPLIFRPLIQTYCVYIARSCQFDEFKYNTKKNKNKKSPTTIGSSITWT